MKTTIIGLGLIGGSLARDLRKSKFVTELIGIDANETHAKQALEIGLVDRIEPLEEGVKNTDMVIIAIPVDKELEVLPKVLDTINSGTTVIDMGSTKRVIINQVKNHKHRKKGNRDHQRPGIHSGRVGHET